MSGYPIIFGEGVDPDAYQYFLRAGIESGTQTPSSYDNAASFNGTNQFLSVASNSSLTVTGTSFTYAFWANAVNTTPNQILISKRDAAGNAREYQIQISGGGLTFSVFPDGSFASTVSAVVTPISANSWNFYVCRYDASAGTIGASINGGAFTTTSSVPALTIVATNPVQFGANPGPVLYYTGQLSSVGFWKKALTASEVTALFNSGAGRTYASLDSGLRTNLISWWALNQNSVTADSAPTGNNLTNNGTPLVTATNIGPIVTTTQNSRQLINNFVKGIKSLGLWNSMVCWPLRSSQNAGGGTTAFSLGGLGQFNGTLVNAPVWGANGIEVVSSGFISTNYQIPNFPLSAFCVLRTTGSQIWQLQSPPIEGRQFEIASNQPLGTASFARYFSNRSSISVPDVSGFWATQTSIIGNRSNNYYVNGSALGSLGGVTGSGDWNSAGNAIPSQICRVSSGFAVFPFLMAINADASQSQANIYTIYKQTLGLGLGLP